MGDIADQLVANSTGVKPLESKVPLKQQITLSQPNSAEARPVGGSSAEDQFAKSFGPEYEHVRAQAEWDTGNPEGNFAKPEPAKVETDPIKVKYPDPAVRQMVRANGENIVQAIGGDKDTMKAVHDLTRVDLRHALVNSGEDMGQTTVSNSKFAGEGSITREAAFNRLLEKGLKPSDIVRLVKKVPQATTQ